MDDTLQGIISEFNALNKSAGGSAASAPASAPAAAIVQNQPAPAPAASPAEPPDKKGVGSLMDRLKKNQRLLQHEPDPTEESDLASSVGQSTLGPPGLHDMGARADLSFSIDNSPEGVEQKKRKFLSYYPNGDIKYVPKYGQYLFKTNKDDPKEQYAKLDPEILQNKGEPLQYTAAGLTAPAAIGGAIALAPEGAIPAMLAASGAEGLRQAEEGLRGYNPHITDKDNSKLEALGGMAKDIGETALTTGVGYGVTRIPEIARNVNKGEGILYSQPARAQLKQDIAANGNLKPLMAGQLAMNPNIARMQNYAETGSSIPVIPKARMAQDASAVSELNRVHSEALNAVEEAGLTNPVQPLPITLQNSIENLRRRLMTKLGAFGRQPSATLGQEVQDGIDAFRKNASKEHSILYNELYNRFKPTFDLSDAKTLADDVSHGVQLSELSPEPKRDSLGNVLINNQGQPIYEEGMKPVDRIKNTQLKYILQTLDRADPVMRPTARPSGAVDTPIQQLLKMRSELYDVKSSPTTDPNEVRIANQLYSALTNAIENPKMLPPALEKPVVGRPRPGTAKMFTPEQLQDFPEGSEFKTMWKNANDVARNNYSLLDSYGVVRAAAQQDYAKLGDTVANPNFSYSQLSELMKVLPQETQDNIRRQFENYVLSSRGLADDMTGRPSQILSKMEKDNPEKLQLLVPDFDRRQALGEVADQMAAFKLAGIEGATRHETENMQLVRRLIKGRDTNAIQQLENLLPRNALGKADLDSPEGRLIREGILNNMKQDVKQGGVVQLGPNGEPTINADAMGTFMADLRNSTADRFLKPTDRDLVNLLHRYTEATKSGTDMGNSLAGTERISALEKIIEAPKKALGALSSMYFKLPLSSKILTSKYADDVLYGSMNKQGYSNTYLHKLASIMANVYKDDIARPGDKNKQPTPQSVTNDYSGFGRY